MADQKLDNLLNLAMNATEEEREKSREPECGVRRADTDVGDYCEVQQHTGFSRGIAWRSWDFGGSSSGGLCDCDSSGEHSG